MTDNHDEEQKRKYTVVDKRGFLDDDGDTGEAGETAEATENAAGADSQRQPADSAADSHEPTQDDGADNGPSAAREDQQEQKEISINDTMRVAMNMLRERAIIALGLVISRDRPAQPDMNQVEKISSVFGALADSFADELGKDNYTETPQNVPPIEETFSMCFNMLQGQIYMHMGLVANPVTGLVVKDLPQAKTGIDFFAALLDNSRAMLSQDVSRKLDAALSDLRINYVNQMNA